MEKPARRRKAKRAVLAAGAMAAGALTLKRVSPVHVEGESMAPLLPNGALVAVAPLRDAPQLGAIVVVLRPDGSEHLKRVVAGPGERFVGPAGLTVTLGPDEYAVMGDNRGASTDSRNYGPVAQRDIVAVARVCYWPPRAWRLLSG